MKNPWNLFAFLAEDDGGGGDRQTGDKGNDGGGVNSKDAKDGDKKGDGGKQLTEAQVREIAETDRKKANEVAMVKMLEERVEKNVGYYERHKDEWEALKQKMGVEGGDPAGALQRVQVLELRLARKEALMEFGLEKGDEQFLTGDTPEQIGAQAAALAKRVKKPKGKGGGAKDEEIGDLDEEPPVLGEYADLEPKDAVEKIGQDINKGLRDLAAERRGGGGY